MPLELQSLARAASGGAVALANPSSVAVTFRSAFTPPWTTRPFAAVPAPPPAQNAASSALSKLVLGVVRPAFDLQAGNEIVSLEPGGDPDQLPLGKLTVALTALGIGFAGYGFYRFMRDVVFTK